MPALPWILSVPLWFVGLSLAVWSALSVYFSALPGGVVRSALAGLIALGYLVAWVRARPPWIAGLWTLGISLACLTAFVLTPPSNSRNWVVSMRRSPRTTISDTAVTVHDVRTFEYRSEEDFTPRWEDRTYDLASVKTLDLIVCYWSLETIAHTMLSFGFEDGRQLVLSVEARLEVGEAYSVIAGMFQQFEIVYLLTDERDEILLRANHRGEDVYVFPVEAPPELVRELFEEVAWTVNELAREPRWYRSVGHNCTTTLVDLVNGVAPDPIPYARRILLNGYVPELGVEQGWLVSSLPLDEYRRRCFVSDLARAHGDAPGFSQAIRARLAGEL